ncbi:MAG: hypothetical protein U0T02_14175 [Solirubrobacteraceae bacterium]
MLAKQAGLIALMAAGSVLLWLGLPFLWIYLASKLVETSRPSFGPYLLILVGIPASMFVVGKGLSSLNRAYGRLTGATHETRPVQATWLRSMRGERGSTRERSVLDVVMVISVGTALLLFAIWFFAFAGSSLPS